VFLFKKFVLKKSKQLLQGQLTFKFSMQLLCSYQVPFILTKWSPSAIQMPPILD